MAGVYADLIERALVEDVGSGDVTTLATVGEELQAVAVIRMKQDGVVSGLGIAEEVFLALDPDTKFERLPDVAGGGGSPWLSAGTVVVRISGRARALLTGERTALNFLAHLSGIATETAKVVRAVSAVNSSVRILDTRKTTPGLRVLEKVAVSDGGGANHRTGLFDAVLIKENHIAVAGGISEAISMCRGVRSELPLVVEVRDTDEIAQALAAGAPRLLLDNMTPEQIAEAVEQIAGRAEVEVSGGISADNILGYARIDGVDYISLGAITHSAPALDLSMVIETK